MKKLYILMVFAMCVGCSGRADIIPVAEPVPVYVEPVQVVPVVPVVPVQPAVVVTPY